MDDFEFDYQELSNQKKQLEKLTSDRYWSEYKGDWKRYLTDAFKWDDTPISYDKLFRAEVKIKPHPFHKWIE